MKHYDSKECTPKCRSARHARELISIITRTSNTQILLSAVNQCYNCHKIQDDAGRYIIHMAASCGRSKLVEWLVQHKKNDMQLKTLENGWTPAHCCSFYGHIDTLITLIKLGANLIKNDHDRLTPLEHLSLDKWQSMILHPEIKDGSDIYSWGSNENYNLGIGHDMKKSNAEVVEFFKKSDISICQIVISKFHTVFLSDSGKVYTCGFGIDGRLGHNDELALIAPKLVETLKDLKCVQIAASRNNTYFLTNDGILYGCGTNNFKQLGQMSNDKHLVPKLINLGKRFKTRKIKQIECGKFHCILLTDTKEVFTFGLNAGQQGHPYEMVENQTNYNNTICYISEPRIITALNEPDIKIDKIACSDACTVALQLSKNLIYLFTGYKCRRLFYINQTSSSFKKLRVQGGRLDNSVCSDLKSIENFNDPLLIVGLTESSLLFIWRENDPVWRKITWSSNKKILIADFDLNLQGLILCTIQGVCYKAQFPKSKAHKHNNTHNQHNFMTPNLTPTAESKHGSESTSKNSPPFDSKFDSSKVDVLELCQIPFVNRCLQVVCDKKARNFFALQYYPTANMRNYPMLSPSLFSSNMELYLNENISKSESSAFDPYSYADPFDNLKSHDIEFKYNGSVFCLNKFILLTRCSKFVEKLKLNDNANTLQFDLENYITRKYSIHAINLLMRYIYAGKCSQDLIRTSLKAGKISSEANFLKFILELKDLLVDKFGFKELKSALDQNRYTRLIKDMSLNSKSNDERLNLMSNLIEKLLSDPKYRKKIYFNRKSYTDLFDCHIKCNDNQILECHKCILVARSEYFQNMLLGCWIESSQQVVDLPFDIDLMQIIVDYLYTDEIEMEFVHASDNISASTKSKNEREIEILFNLFVLSDQLLLERLKNKCEFKLANLVNLKNVVEIFEFASEYEAKQLKEFSMEFIVCNLVTLIEAKQLESVSLDLLKDVSSFYRSYFRLVGSRIITPYSNEIDMDKIDLIPFELLYDQKFIDGGIDDERRKHLSSRDFSGLTKSPANEFTKSPENNLKETKLNTEIENIPKQTSRIYLKDSNEKWEKVGKKSRRKISEKETNIQQLLLNSGSNKSTSPPINISKVGSPIRINSQLEILDLDSPRSLETKANDDSNSINEWPSLGDNVVVKKKEPEMNHLVFEKKKIPKPRQKMTAPEKEQTPKSAPKLAWGGINSKKTTSEASGFSLLDVMNEEMKNLKVNSKNEIQVPKKSFVKAVPQTEIVCTKGWNIPDKSSFDSARCSIANIIEMEKRSNDQYKKLTNRPLNTIQLEEAAIDRLNKYYDIDNVFDITIKIELIDDDLKDCAPVWRKK